MFGNNVLFHYQRCVKCAEDHYTGERSKDPLKPAKCALCSGNHTAISEGCPTYQFLPGAKKIYSHSRMIIIIKKNYPFPCITYSSNDPRNTVQVRGEKSRAPPPASTPYE